MRVIAGKARSIQLKAPEGMETRPTTDRIKETLFNMINNSIYNSCFLDMFAGSGGIGIEALSRGARKAYFVESNRKACSVIEANLSKTHLEEDAFILNTNALNALSRLSSDDKFDIVFMDPPYGKGLEKEILSKPAFINILNEDALVIVESDLDTLFTKDEFNGLRIVKEKIYKTNKHTFFEKTDDNGNEEL